jgi:hypothetical protein
MQPTRGLFRLYFVYGIPLALNAIQALGLTAQIPLWALLVGTLLLSPFLGLIGIAISSWLLLISGKILGGVAPFAQVRTAVAWSNVPSIITLLTWGVLLLMFGDKLLNQTFSQVPVVGIQAGVLFLSMLVEIVVSVWGFIILLSGLAAVQGFSLWRAFLNVVIPFVAVVIFAWLGGWILQGASQIGNH